ncbi:MAG: hypothetical protein IJJ04_02295, partial [Clostridia bacterium]|nr:hypothetical protein [Clostridia bacterium]
KDGNLLTNRPNLLERTKCYEYFELQFHGDLSFKEDVESVDIIRTYIEDENEREAQYKQQEMLAENIKKQGKICNIIDCTDIV